MNTATWMKNHIILKNVIQCNKCKDIIESKHRHDFVTCSCGACANDGGRDYMRRLGNPDDYTDMSVFADEDDIALIRECLTWKSFGPNGDQEGKYILFKDLTDDHIANILRTQRHIKGTWIEKVLMLELQYRKDHA